MRVRRWLYLTAGAAAVTVACTRPIPVDFVGCRDLRGNDCGRLADLRGEYAWESASEVEERLSREREGTRVPSPALEWRPFETNWWGRARLGYTPGLHSEMHLLHVRLKSRRWDWFPFPGPVHPGTLAGAAAFEAHPRGPTLRLTLVRKD